ncbi:polysaccharide biosynthesis tyrosine autokinase [Desulfomarina sp.]
MGNISDILEKSGVDLGGGENPSRPGKATSEKRVAEKDSFYSAGAWDERLLKVTNENREASESFRILRSRILYPREGQARPQTIMVTSNAPEEGKSFVSANLAITMARGLDQYSLLVDCDLRRPSVASLFGLSSVCRKGLTDYLRDGADPAELIFRTTVEKLSIIPSGDCPVNPAELLASARMSDLVNELSGRYNDRFIIFDSPPYLLASESNVLAKEVDAVVLVVGYGKSDREKVKTMIEQIGQDKIIGIVFNGMKTSYLKKKILGSYNTYSKYTAPESSDSAKQ